MSVREQERIARIRQIIDGRNLIAGLNFVKLAVDPGRYLLVEESTRGHGIYVSIHDSPEEAGLYHANQEYAGDWYAEELVNLETGSRYEVAKIYVKWGLCVSGYEFPTNTEGDSVTTSEPASTLYEKCAHCHLFVDHNDVGPTEFDDVAPYIHLHRGTAEDEKLDASHEATPSGQIATLETWRAWGPEAMRQRFITYVVLQQDDPYGNPQDVGVVGPFATREAAEKWLTANLGVDGRCWVEQMEGVDDGHA